MQQTIRVDDNLALEAALWLATRVGLELVVVVRVVIMCFIPRQYDRPEITVCTYIMFRHFNGDEKGTFCAMTQNPYFYS